LGIYQALKAVHCEFKHNDKSLSSLANALIPWKQRISNCALMQAFWLALGFCEWPAQNQRMTSEICSSDRCTFTDLQQWRSVVHFSKAMANKLAAKQLTLERTLAAINQELGDGSIMRLGDASHMKVETFSSGSTELDLALGGGYLRGRVIEIYGLRE
jgi:recA bacterial DNA recombination protein